LPTPDNSSSPTPPGRFNWEEERQKLAASSPSDPGDGVPNWDQPAPTESPINRRLQIPGHLNKIVGFFKGIIGDEGLLMDLVLDHTMDLVKRNVEQRTFGVDGFQGEMGQVSPIQYAALAGPLTVELYREVTKAVAMRADEYAKLHQEALQELQKKSVPEPARIIIPG